MDTVKFFTLGCKVNQYETQAIRESFLKSGFSEVESGKIADIYLINSCTVTARADKKSLELVKKSLEENPDARVIITGCYVQKECNDFVNDKRIIVVKNESKNKIIEILENESAKKIQRKKSSYLKLNISDFKGHNRAFIKIQDGCENTCSYCKVTLVRGNLKSRRLSEIKEEARCLIKKGFKEIVLTGICLGAYGKDLKAKVVLCDAIEEILSLSGEFRLRASSIEAKHVSTRLIDLLSNSSKLCSHIHIPFQSGDNEVLRKMNRHYSREDYLLLVRKIRARIPEIALTTDVIVGFPGEKDKNFDNTFAFLREVSPCRMHIFPFSPREGTKAYGFSNKVSAKVIKLRMERLKILAKKKSLEYRHKFLKKRVKVLVETTPDKKSGRLKGYSNNYINVLLDILDINDKFINRLINAEITKVGLDFTLARHISE